MKIPTPNHYYFIRDPSEDLSQIYNPKPQIIEDREDIINQLKNESRISFEKNFDADKKDSIKKFPKSSNSKLNL